MSSQGHSSANGASTRGRVPPVVGDDRPLWSVMIPTYNCAVYLSAALESVLQQDPGPERMQIEVVDDASGDDPEAVVERVGRGRVGFHRHPRNLGHVDNFNACLERARGRLVYILHGDDRILPGFVDRMERAFEEDLGSGPGVGAAFCRHLYVDEADRPIRTSTLERPEPGVLEDALERMTIQQRVQPPSIVVRRDVYEAIGGFDRRFRSCAEDREMWVRIASRYPIWFEPEVLACYRKHPASLASRAYRTGQNLRDERTAIRTFSAYLPPEQAGEWTAAARESAARWGLALADQAVARGDRKTARVQLLQAFRTRPSLRTARRAVAILRGRTGP